MRRPRPGSLVLALALVALAGCRSNCDLVEAELRSRERDVQQMDEHLRRTKAYNRYLQQELQQWQQAAAGHAIEGAVLPPSPVKSINLGRQTGGLDEDGCPGDEALQVVIEPRDFENHPIKASATVQIQALEVTAEGVKKPIGAWTVPADELRRHWRGGLLSTGYFLTFPWKVPPASSKVRVIVQWVGPEGKPFEAERDFTVKLMPAALRKPEGGEPPPPPLMPKEPATPVPPMPPADGEQKLPSPTPVAPPVVPPPVVPPPVMPPPLPPTALPPPTTLPPPSSPPPSPLPLPQSDPGPTLPLPIDPVQAEQAGRRMAENTRRPPAAAIMAPRPRR